jgi:hypothetical protein
MRDKEIVVDIDEDGNLSIEGQNFSGPECEKYIKEISESLGEVTHLEHKREYRQTINDCQRERSK